MLTLRLVSVCGSRGGGGPGGGAGGGADAILCFSSPPRPRAIYTYVCVSTLAVSRYRCFSPWYWSAPAQHPLNILPAAVTATSSAGWSVITKWWHQVCNVQKSGDTVTCLVHHTITQCTAIPTFSHLQEITVHMEALNFWTNRCPLHLHIYLCISKILGATQSTQQSKVSNVLRGSLHLF